MRNYLDIVPCGFFSFTDDGSIGEVNESLCTLLRYSKEELYTKKLQDICTIATRIFFQTHFFPLLKMQTWVEEIFLTLLTKDKTEVPVLLNARRVNENGKTENVCICISVYNRKKFEDELIAAKERVETALRENTDLLWAKQQLQAHAEALDERVYLLEQQNEELIQFNRIVTHDLQEPLRKIMLFADQLLSQQKEIVAEKTRGIVQRITRASGHMKRMVAGLQQYAWLATADSEMTAVDLADLVKSVQKQLNAEDANLLQLHIDPLPVIQAHWDQMALLFYQLLSNAVKFCKPGEPAEVQIKGTIIQENMFKMSPGKYKYQDVLRIEVSDKGIGFDPHYKEQVFQLFKKLHTKNNDLGLGLALCKKIASNHQGIITVQSKPGEGASFTIVLPLQSNKVAEKTSKVHKHAD